MQRVLEVPGLDNTARGRGMELALTFTGFSSKTVFLLSIDRQDSYQFNTIHQIFC